MRVLLPLLGLLAFLAPSLGIAQSKGFALKAPLDALVELPDNWSMTLAEFEKKFTNEEKGGPRTSFKWLTKDKDRALFSRQPYSNVRVDLSLFDTDIRVEEAVVDFVDGKLNAITFSLYNRGDAGSIGREEFDERFRRAGEEMSTRLKVRPFRREANPAQGLLTEGWTWASARGMAVLERNPATDKKLEFLRLRLMRRDAKGAMANSMRSRSGSTVRLSDLPRNVAKERESGIVHIENIPMVDQGPKGYCVVASAQRLLEYYGIPCDQHQLAAICGTETSGTDSGAMMEALRKIDHRFKLRFRPLALSTNRGLRAVVRDKEFGKAVDGDDFFEIVVDSIDDGIPMLWVLELGRYPEKPAIAPQTRGAHMRLITGYNKETGRIYFSDSWGAGHERKSMAVGHAYQATFGVFHLNPTTR